MEINLSELHALMVQHPTVSIILFILWIVGVPAMIATLFYK